MAYELKRYLHEDGQFKAVVVDATGVGRDAFQRLSPSPIGIQLLTQAMTGALLISSTLKGASALMFRFEGEGPAEHITVEANTAGHVRGFLGNPAINFQRDAEIGLFQQALAFGHLRVKRKSEETGKVFTSVVPLVEGEIALNFAHYLMQSEQIGSGIQLGANLDPELGVAGAGGVLVQAMPGANDHLLFILEERIKEMGSLGEIFSKPEGHQTIVDWLFEGLAVKQVGVAKVEYRCTCTRQRMLQILATLPLDDLRDLTKEKSTEIRCSFCTKPFTWLRRGYRGDHRVEIKPRLNLVRPAVNSPQR